MGFLTDALQKRATVTTGLKLTAEPSKQLMTALGGGESPAGVTVTPEMSTQIGAVFACIRNIAEDEATLPLILYERLTGGGKERAVKHYLYDILHNLPNPEMTSVDLRQTSGGHLGTWGNAFLYLQRDGLNNIHEVWPLRPDRMSIARKENGELEYQYTVERAGVTYYWSMNEVMHLRGLGSNGILGYSMTRLQMRSQGLAWALEDFGSRFFGNGARPGYVLKHPGQLSDPAYNHLLASTEERHGGLDKSHRAMILEEGMGIEVIGVPPEEAQFLETRKFQRSDIAGWYRMPPHMIGDLERATFSNIEQQSIEYVVMTLRPWLVRWEQEIARSMLTAVERKTLYVEHLVDGLLRGDITARYSAYGIAVDKGWMNRNEVREKENMNPKPGLDRHLIPLNMAEVGAPSKQPVKERSIDGLGSLIDDLASRISRRFVNDARAGLRKLGNGPIGPWIEEFRGGWQEDFSGLLEPLFLAAGKLGGVDLNMVDQWASRLSQGFVLQEWELQQASLLEGRQDEWQRNAGFEMADRIKKYLRKYLGREIEGDEEEE